jgi:hypothetical protein
MPPTTPPAIAPALVELDGAGAADGVDDSEVLAEESVVLADESVLMAGEPVLIGVPDDSVLIASDLDDDAVPPCEKPVGVADTLVGTPAPSMPGPGE